MWIGRQGKRDREKERKKSFKGFPEAEDKNIEESEENFPLLRRISIRRVSGLLEFAGPFQWIRRVGEKKLSGYHIPFPL